MANRDHLLSKKGREEKVLYFNLGKLNSLLNKRFAGNVPMSSCFCSRFLPLSEGI